jgi:hypothetical protein
MIEREGGEPIRGFAFGGNSVDNQFAYLRKGEMVMNRDAVRQIMPSFKQLNNATAVNKSQGGNVTFGDINITMPTGTTTAQVETVITELKRRMSRGTF